ncbi:DUF4260 domain-containing protein [Acidicapsa acidisoli]|uniref:DUF4260 domain-containing protein n=1 Tax=Acidicapsa acidisoli TaxID=1615681 RepID=UPI0021DFDB59|nr:DUF4260 domain-containing protein [Acidicapsa acidisoli]
MTSASSLPAEKPAVAPPVLWWLRLEGLAVAALAVVLYARTGASWWLFAVLWLVPDLSMVGYFVDPRLGANCYNAIHSYLLPITLAVAALSFQRAALPFVLIWFNHIGVDRLLGYGLKYPTAFGHTHLTEPRRLQAPRQHAPQK